MNGTDPTGMECEGRVCDTLQETREAMRTEFQGEIDASSEAAGVEWGGQYYATGDGKTGYTIGTDGNQRSVDAFGDAYAPPAGGETIGAWHSQPPLGDDQYAFSQAEFGTSGMPGEFSKFSTESGDVAALGYEMIESGNSSLFLDLVTNDGQLSSVSRLLPSSQEVTFSITSPLPGVSGTSTMSVPIYLAVPRKILEPNR